MATSIITRKFHQGLTKLMETRVKAITKQGKSYIGKIGGLDPSTMNILIVDAQDEEGNNYTRVFIPGENLAELIQLEKEFDLKALAERLEKVFKNMVTLHEDLGVIVVMDRIRVTKDGVVEGKGPAAERVQKIYEQFLAETEGAE